MVCGCEKAVGREERVRKGVCKDRVGDGWLTTAGLIIAHWRSVTAADGLASRLKEARSMCQPCGLRWARGKTSIGCSCDGWISIPS